MILRPAPDDTRRISASLNGHLLSGIDARNDDRRQLVLDDSHGGTQRLSECVEGRILS